MHNLNKIWFHYFESALRSLFLPVTMSACLTLTSPLVSAQIHPKTEMRAVWIATVNN